MHACTHMKDLCIMNALTYQLLLTLLITLRQFISINRKRPQRKNLGNIIMLIMSYMDGTQFHINKLWFWATQSFPLSRRHLPCVEYWTCCTGFEWNKHRCMYVHIVEFILVDVVTLLYKDEVIWNGNHSSLYTNATIEDRGWNCSQKYNWNIWIE